MILMESFTDVPSGKHINIAMDKVTICSWVNQLFLWAIFNSKLLVLPEGKELETIEKKCGF